MSTLTLTDNKATVNRMYEAFSRGDIPYILDQLADNCQWIAGGKGSLPQGGVYIGKDAANFFAELMRQEEILAFNVTSIHIINSSEAVSFGNMDAASRATGKKFSTDWTMHWKFNEQGKVVYFQDFFDTAAVYIAKQR